jgi:hypothetical protein
MSCSPPALDAPLLHELERLYGEIPPTSLLSLCEGAMSFLNNPSFIQPTTFTNLCKRRHQPLPAVLASAVPDPDSNHKDVIKFGLGLTMVRVGRLFMWRLACRLYRIFDQVHTHTVHTYTVKHTVHTYTLYMGTLYIHTVHTHTVYTLYILCIHTSVHTHIHTYTVHTYTHTLATSLYNSLSLCFIISTYSLSAPL